MRTKIFLVGIVIVALLVFATKLIAQPVEENILIILDMSKSMDESLSRNQTKYDAAIKAVKDVLEMIPGNTNLGLRVYGHKNGLMSINQCSQTELVAPIRPENKGRILSEIQKLRPTGVTPIELSLKKAMEDFKHVSGPRRIILISDGIETCYGNPCNFARTMKSRDNDIKVDVISLGRNIQNFSLDSQLQCIAGATDGTFNRAETQIDLVNAIYNSVKIDKNVYWEIKPNY